MSAPAVATGTPIVSVAGLVFDYPTQRALDGIDIAVERGSVLALVGPNGAGKSTLMRVICGLDEPVAGTVQVAGINVLEHSRQAQAKIGFLSDFFGLYDELSVHQCLLHAGSLRALEGTRLQAAVHKACTRTGILGRLTDRAGSLSRGLRQRLAIAQAIVHDPDVIVLDEPAAGLDPEARAALSALFRSLQAEGKTLIVSSHILAELEEYSTHMLALRDGKVIEYQRIGSTPSFEGSQRLRIRMAHGWQPPAGFWQAQGAAPTPPAAGADAGDIWIEMPAGDAGAARLLRALVEAGAPVAAFAPQRESLQDSYLRASRARQAVQQEVRP